MVLYLRAHSKSQHTMRAIEQNNRMGSVILAPLCNITSKGIRWTLDTDCMTEAREESKRNQPYFHHIISEQLAIEKTICNKKK